MEALTRGAAALGVRLEPATVSAFEKLLGLLEVSNASLNLTALRDPESIVQRHFLESIALGVQLEQRRLLAAGARVLDLGSGAGFPGLPIKLVWPDIKLWLLEATSKKASFIRHAATALNLADTAVLDGRAEDFAHDAALREQFDLVAARAVAALPALVELSLPYLRLGGVLAAMKGSRAGEETAAAAGALELCGGELIEQLPPLWPGSPGLILIRKSAATPPRYPRRAGQPAAHPLRNRV